MDKVKMPEIGPVGYGIIILVALVIAGVFLKKKKPATFQKLKFWKKADPAKPTVTTDEGKQVSALTVAKTMRDKQLRVAV